MSFKNGLTANLCRALPIVASLMFSVGCGSGGNNIMTSTSTPPATSTTPNTASLAVGFGPLGASGEYVNGIFTTVTVCAPGSTSNCLSVPNVLVDTGSVGLRVLQSALGDIDTALIPVMDSSNSNPIQECMQFADFSYVWGPIVLANVQVAGETAAQVPSMGGSSSGIPMQIITNPPTFPVPSNCLVSSGSARSPTVDANTLQILGASGILGIENFPQDCGGDCTGSSGNVPAQYYTCPNGICASVGVPIASQVWNPVAAFATDNNGELITLPSVTAAGSPGITGSLIFGIGTQANNALGSATIYTTNSMGNFQAAYNGVVYTSFLDTGSNAFYISDHNVLAPTGIVECTGQFVGYYCPNSPISLMATNTGENSTQGSVTLSVANAEGLFASGNSVFNNLGGDSGTGLSSDYWDYGIPFWLGRNVFVGLPTSTYTNGYWAY